eukprot:4057837-Pleurochrysis_carterae.AAC.6
MHACTHACTHTRLCPSPLPLPRPIVRSACRFTRPLVRERRLRAGAGARCSVIGARRSVRRRLQDEPARALRHGLSRCRPLQPADAAPWLCALSPDGHART